SGSGPAVRHRYSDLGAYVVTLVVTDDDGASASLSNTLTVINSRPVAAFEAPSPVESLQETQFIDRSYDLDGSVVGWRWHFGDGGSSSERSPSYVFERPGVYTIELIVTDDRGWMGKTSSIVTVTNRLPEVHITAPEGDHWSLDVLEFSASGRDLDGMVVAYVWDMGDGTSLEGSNVSHVYLAPGDLTVTVTCRDDHGGEASAISVISILNLVPRAEVLTDHGDHPLEVRFIAQAEDDDGELVSYNWSFGDGTFGTGIEVVHRYMQEGGYDVVLTVVDDAGGMVEAQARATVILANIMLSSAELIFDKDEGWILAGEIFNDGTAPVCVTLFVDAGGMWFLKEYNMTAGSTASIYLTLTNFEEGNVTVKVLTPDDWESDLQDNEWTTYVEREDTFPFWLVGLGMVAIFAAIVAMSIRRS
ncbi:MAG TPA: PKD domain-containing protein, partial [Methanomassiliicoccales archaeon]|nr:PKD domain-containing protein [Methanomassiliicoccales archaeon]